MKTLYTIIFSIFFSFANAQIFTDTTQKYIPLIIDSSINNVIKNKSYPYKDSKPTTKGIDDYVSEQSVTVIFDFDYFFKVESDDVDFVTDNINKYKENNENDTQFPTIESNIELGNYDLVGNYITITNEEKYLDYSLKTINKKKISDIAQSNKFVRSVMIHEYVHAYMKQIILELRMNNIKIEKEYYAQFYESIGSTFIEEGISEYCSSEMGELINSKIEFIPKTEREILDKINRYDIFYKYSSIYVRDFLRKNGLKKGIQILVTNKPPTIEEIITPYKFFFRLNF